MKTAPAVLDGTQSEPKNHAVILPSQTTGMSQLPFRRLTRAKAASRRCDTGSKLRRSRVVRAAQPGASLERAGRHDIGGAMNF
jgi:hypothetical protein